jgi:murein L,D-transpeptidase YcbB/YkuD
MPLGDKARKAARLCQQLLPGHDWSTALQELATMYPHAMFKRTQGIATSGLSVIYVAKASVFKTGVKFSRSGLPKAVQFQATWLAQLTGGLELVVEKTKIHPPENTRLNIRQFQEMAGLVPDGIEGPRTKQMLDFYFSKLSTAGELIKDPPEPPPPRTRWDRILGDDL